MTMAAAAARLRPRRGSRRHRGRVAAQPRAARPPGPPRGDGPGRRWRRPARPRRRRAGPARGGVARRLRAGAGRRAPAGGYREAAAADEDPPHAAGARRDEASSSGLLALVAPRRAAAFGAQDTRAPARGQGALLRPEVRRGARAWQGSSEHGGPEAEAAAYWVARCSENLSEKSARLQGVRRLPRPRARRPGAGRGGADEPRRPRRAAVKAGQRDYLPILRDGPRRSEQDRALLRRAPARGLGADVGQPAVPVLKADRRRGEGRRPRGAGQAAASCGLEPAAPGPRAGGQPHRRSPQAPPRQRPGSGCGSTRRAEGEARGLDQPPVALAELVFKSLPDEARAEAAAQGASTPTTSGAG